MSTFTDLIGRKGIAVLGKKFPSLVPGKGADGDDLSAAESWAEIGSRIGGDNEVLRNLLVNIGHRIGALDDLQKAFNKIVHPIHQTLRALEHEKSDNAILRRALGDIRINFETVRVQFSEFKKKAASDETENERLRHELDFSQQAARDFETTKIELADELATTRGKIANLERQLALETANGRMLDDRNEKLADRAATADKRMVELEGEVALTREKFVLLEIEKQSLNRTLDQTVADNSRLSRRLAESETSLENARSRLEQMNTALTAAETERNKLTTALDEANEQRRTEINTLNMRLEAAHLRATAADKLLADLRQSKLTHNEENRVSERKAVEANIVRNSTEKKLEQLSGLLQAQESQIRDLEQSRATLVERTNALTKTVNTREMALARAEEKVQALTHRVTQLETEADFSLSKTEKRIEELNSTLQREQLERAVAEGALQTTRKNHAELQRELAAERAGRTVEKPGTDADASAPNDAAKPKADKGKTASAVGPKVASGGGTVQPIITP